MSWNIDEEEFYETFSEIESERGIGEAKKWAWSVIDYTQKELDREKALSSRLPNKVNTVE